MCKKIVDIYIYIYSEGAHSGMVIVVGNGHRELSSILEKAVGISHGANTLG